MICAKDLPFHFNIAHKKNRKSLQSAQHLKYCHEKGSEHYDHFNRWFCSFRKCFKHTLFCYVYVFQSHILKHRFVGKKGGSHVALGPCICFNSVSVDETACRIESEISNLKYFLQK